MGSASNGKNEDKSKEYGAISSRQLIKPPDYGWSEAFKCLPTAGIQNEADIPRERNGSGIPSRTQ